MIRGGGMGLCFIGGVDFVMHGGVLGGVVGGVRAHLTL